MITILDVLENFISSLPSAERDISRMPGSALFELGEQVRKFANEYALPAPASGAHPAYLGGWPSANFWDAQNGPLAMTALLYSGQLLAKDPISDWFSLEQYLVPTKMAARAGFLDVHTRQFNGLRTRRFLMNVVPAILRLKPLIASGAIVLVPSRKHFANNIRSIEALADEITVKVGRDLYAFTRQFNPPDLPMEDNLRGMVVYSGGDRKGIVRSALEHSARYFASEYILSIDLGYNYTAIFDYESHLCREGLESSISEAVGAKVLSGLFKSRWRIFKGLTPEILASIRNDESFGTLRSALYQAYRDIPLHASQRELDQYLADAESAVIDPQLQEIARSADRGLFSRIGIELKRAGVQMGISVLGGLAATGGQGAGAVIAASGTGAVAGLCASLVRKRPRTAPVIWKRLLTEGTRIEELVPRSRTVPQTGDSSRSGELWGIPDKPSRQLFISAGVIIANEIAPGDADPTGASFPGSTSNPYGLCPCRSGRKYKFCCHGLDSRRVESPS